MNAPRPRARSLELAQQLIAFHTVSDQSNLPLIEFVEAELARLGVRSRITRSADRRKANLFATLGDSKAAGVILSGHTDTVPWDGQVWAHDPLRAVEADGRLYGRGSADMKGFIAVALAHAQDFAESDADCAVHLALSYDEETGCFGVPGLIADMKEAGIAPLACVVGEPTGMVPSIAHKGVFRYRCCVRGKEAHSSLTPQSVNALEMAARVVCKVRDMAEDFERSEPRYEGFDVPFTTASVGQFRGGIADNVVPRDAEFRYEFRSLPGVDARALQAQVVAYAQDLQLRMRQVDPGAGFQFEPICEVPAFLGEADAAITRLAQRLTQQSRTGLVAFGTEAGFFQRAGVPTVICGPGHIAQAHQPDEYVDLSQLALCEAFMRGLLGVRRADLNEPPQP